VAKKTRIGENNPSPCDSGKKIEAPTCPGRRTRHKVIPEPGAIQRSRQIKESRRAGRLKEKLFLVLKAMASLITLILMPRKSFMMVGNCWTATQTLRPEFARRFFLIHI